jgi:hypothetical protein
MNRTLRNAAVFLLALTALGLALIYFFGLPRIRQSLDERVEEAFATDVIPEVVARYGTPVAGSYTLTEEQLVADLRAADPRLENLQVELSPSRITVRLPQPEGTIEYTASLAVENGRLVFQNERLKGLPGWALPVDTISDGIERAVDNELRSKTLQVSAVETSESAITIILEPRA